jgi:ABC-2 type transport system ATP-binding protein
VTIELSEGVDPDRLRTYGELEIMDGQEVRFLVQREALTTAIAKILAELPVLDLSINDPPIEEVIGRLFASGRLETRSEDI